MAQPRETSTSWEIQVGSVWGWGNRVSLKPSMSSERREILSFRSVARKKASSAARKNAANSAKWFHVRGASYAGHRRAVRGAHQTRRR